MEFFLWCFTFNSAILNTTYSNSRYSPLPVLADTTTRRDCNEERRLAQDSDRLEPEGRIFIPECSEEGLYRREQCHTATGYCWYVLEVIRI